MAIEFLKKVYKGHQNDIKKETVFMNFLKKLTPILNILCFDYLGATISFIVAPLIIYLISGSIVSILPFDFPGTDSKTIGGYALSSIFHILVIISVGGLYIYSDGLFTVLVFHVFLLSDILKEEIAHFDYLSTNRGTTPLEVRKQTLNIFIKHRDMIE